MSEEQIIEDVAQAASPYTGVLGPLNWAVCLHDHGLIASLSIKNVTSPEDPIYLGGSV